MTICIFDSHYKTKLYLRVGGADVSALVCANPLIASTFCSADSGIDVVLDISDKEFFNNRLITYQDHSKFNMWKYTFSDKYPIDLINLIGLDRRLSELDMDEALEYLHFIYSRLDSFFGKHEFDYVLLEPTWAHEILGAMYLEKIGIPVIQLKKCKIRPDHFYIFKSYFDVDFYPNTSGDFDEFPKITNDKSSKKIKNFDFDSKRNSSLKRLAFGFFRVSREAIKGEHNYFIHGSFTKILQSKFRSVFRFMVIKFLKNIVKGKDYKMLEKPFIYFPLHYEPEASILVSGQCYRDQLATLMMIRELLDPSIAIVVKEHPHCLGNRPFEFYRSLRQLPGVILIETFEQSRDVISKSIGVVAIAGTAVLEAYLMNKPGFTIAEMYFSQIWPKKTCLGENLERLVNMKGVFRPDPLLMSEIASGGFRGCVEVRPDDLGVFETNNVDNIRKALRLTCAKYV